MAEVGGTFTGLVMRRKDENIAQLRARIKELEAEKVQAVLDEREACAKVCDVHALSNNHTWDNAARTCGIVIRARSKQT